jgi:hypothetical protein
MQILNKMFKNSKFLSDFFPGPLLGVRKSGKYPLYVLEKGGLAMVDYNRTSSNINL